MKRSLDFSWLAPLALFFSPLSWAMNHLEVSATIQPEQSWLSASSQLKLASPSKQLEFDLHSGLTPSIAGTGQRLEQVLDSSTEAPSRHRYRVVFETESTGFTLQYSGSIFHAVQNDQTAGLISSDGIHLSGTSSWFPQIVGENLLTFELTIIAPSDYLWISQGSQTSETLIGKERVTTWKSSEPQQEIQLEGARFHRFEQSYGSTQILAYLRSNDAALARRYLDATGPYIGMYSRLLGNYPYSKFALVENFFETGYGMPSYTLLGPSVIRLPFILQSSYPHEILHNWWGNSVYVEYSTGNWCEGLTAYLADHLLQEQSGSSTAHRREILQKFTNFVSDKNDFPLTRFQSRFDDASSAIGYGKAAMFFHMLRARLGDKTFTRGLQNFFIQKRFRMAGYTDLRDEWIKESGDATLTEEFQQWTERLGAPQLRIDEVSSEPQGSQHRLQVRITQTQSEAPFSLRVPVAIHLEGQSDALQMHLNLSAKNGRTQDISIFLPSRPTRFELDPEFDVFRRLGADEMPPSLSMVFGSSKALIVLPSNAPIAQQASYLALAEALRQNSSGTAVIRRDDELTELPSNSATWLLGAENRFATQAAAAMAAYGVTVTDAQVTGLASSFPRADHSFVFVANPSQNPQSAMGWIMLDPSTAPAAFQSLAGKLKHYGKFSHAVFQSERATNRLKGEWPILESSLSLPVLQKDGVPVVSRRGNLAPRLPLITL